MDSTMYFVIKNPSYPTGQDLFATEYTPKVVFEDRDEAELHAHRLDLKYQTTKDALFHNPFTGSRFDELTSRVEKEIRKLFRKLSIPEPEASALPTANQTYGLSMDQKEEMIEWSRTKVWKDWWEKMMIGGLLTADQALNVWEAFDLFRFHLVKIIRAQAVNKNTAKLKKVYGILQNEYLYNDAFYDSTDTIQYIYRVLNDAHEECSRLNIEFRHIDDGYDSHRTFYVIELDRKLKEVV